MKKFLKNIVHFGNENQTRTNSQVPCISFETTENRTKYESIKLVFKLKIY